MRKVVAADIHDDAAAAIDCGRFFKCETLPPIIHAKFGGEFRQPFGSAFVPRSAGLADPADVEFARPFRALEKRPPNSVRQQKSSWMPRAGKPLSITRMKHHRVIKYGGPANAAVGKSIRVWMKAHCGDFRTFKSGWK